ncbi:hypothetical protein ACHAXH_006565 [Discostella pseudostelligera]
MDLLSKRKSLIATKDDSSSTDVYASTPAHSGEICGRRHHPTILFVREDNKKCSFALENPILLICEPFEKLRNYEGGALASTNDDIHTARSDTTPANVHDDKTTNTGNGENNFIAAASITSCTISNVSENIPIQSTDATTANEIFLFGGFELITNVKTIEVYVTRPIDDPTASKPDEFLLTTCKGVPMRDLPPLTESPMSMDKNHELGCEGMLGNTLFFKFILVSPGGAKPTERVRLKFVGCDTSSGGSIVVRTLKVKGRLADSIPLPKNSQEQTVPQVNFLIRDTNRNSAIHNIEGNGNTDSISSTTGTPGRNGAIGTPKIASQQQFVQVLQMQSFIQSSTQQQQPHHQQEKNHAEIVNAIAGLGLFLKHSEERTMAKLETMLTNMEMRITERIDSFNERLNAIEQTVTINTSNDDNVVSVAD